MRNLKLLLEFKLAGESRLHVKGAARIKIDGRGGMTLYDVHGDAAETIDLSQLQAFGIETLIGDKSASSFAVA